MQQLDLLFSYHFLLVVVDQALPQWLREGRAFPCEVEVNGPIESLDAVLDEHGDLDVLVLKELIELLSHYHHVVGREAGSHRLKGVNCLVD